MYLRGFPVTVNNPHLWYAKLGIKLKLFIGLITRTADPDHNIRGSLKILVPINPEAFWCEQDKIWNAVVVRPATGRGHVNFVVHSHPPGTRPVQAQVRLHGPFEILVFPVRHWCHMQHALPHFVPPVSASALAPGQDVWWYLRYNCSHDLFLIYGSLLFLLA